MLQRLDISTPFVKPQKAKAADALSIRDVKLAMCRYLCYTDDPIIPPTFH